MPPPLTKAQQAKLAAQQEMASRVLARRRLLPFIERMNPKYMAGWVHQDICRRLERFSDAVAAGTSPRLMLLMPPRHGKSEIASKNFPAWHLGRHPDHEIIACSYNISLAMGFSKKIKALFDDPSFQTVFDARLDPNNQSTEEWGLHGTGGGYVAAGVGGGITGKGAHCLPAGTLISVEGGVVDIEQLYQLKCRPKVLSYDRSTNSIVARRVIAFSVRKSSDLFELTTVRGVKLVLTGDHPIYMPDMDVFIRADRLEAMYGTSESNDRSGLHVLPDGVSAQAVRPREIDPVKMPRLLLLGGVQQKAPRREEREGVCALRRADIGEWPQEQEFKILQQGMLEGEEPTTGRHLSGMRGYLRAAKYAYNVLLARLRKRGPRQQDDRSGELSLQRRSELRQMVRGDAPDDSGARSWVRHLPENSKTARTSCGSQSGEQPSGQLGSFVRQAPYGSPQICYDTLAVVRRVRSSPVTVYDLEVEDTHNFFAEGICVHNCLIIDDPVKNAEEADSANTRESIWDWYGSTAYTRLAPGGGVLVVQTFWHDDDLAGRLQQAMQNDPDSDQFEIIKYPALADEAEFLDPGSDEIIRIPVQHAPDAESILKFAEAVTAAQAAGYDPAKLTYLRGKGDPLHEARYDRKKLLRIKATIAQRFWSALYQQNPVPDDGAFFTKDQFKRGELPRLRESVVQIAWDFAISEKQHNDYTVGTVGLLDYDDTLHIAEVIRFKKGDAFFIVDSILNLAQRWYHPSLILGFEDGQIFRSIEALLKKGMRERHFYPRIEVLKPITDKKARASALQGRMQQGMVSFNSTAEWYDTARQEMLRFPAGVHDDIVDSMAWMAQLAVGREPPQKPKIAAQKSWKDKLRIGGGSAGHMSA